MVDALQLRFGVHSQALNNFDLAWQSWSFNGSGKAPELAAFFPSDPPPREFVIELVKVDLDFWWRYAEKLTDAIKNLETVDLSGASSDQKQAASLAAVDLPPRPKLEDYVSRFPVLGALESLPIELIELEFTKRHAYGDQPSVAEFTARFPTHGESLRALLQRWWENRSPRKMASPSSDVAGPEPGSDAATGASVAFADRYRKMKKLGEGAFGTVWLAEHLELGKLVALKEPRAERFGSEAEIEAYLHEARVLASLDHPHIVPVYSCGSHGGRTVLRRVEVRGRHGLGCLPQAKAIDIHTDGGVAGVRGGCTAADTQSRAGSPRHQARQHLDRQPWLAVCG